MEQIYFSDRIGYHFSLPSGVHVTDDFGNSVKVMRSGIDAMYIYTNQGID